MLKYDELMDILNEMFDGDLTKASATNVKEGLKASLWLTASVICGVKAIKAYGKSWEAVGKVSALTKMANVQWEYWQPYD